MARTRSLLRLTLALALAASTQGFLFVQASFSVNQDWIAETLCVNRDRPETKCNGHCVLMERMGAHDHGKVPAVLEVALSVRMWLAPPPRLAAPPDADRPDALGPLVAAASEPPSAVFRPPRAV